MKLDQLMKTHVCFDNEDKPRGILINTGFLLGIEIDDLFSCLLKDLADNPECWCFEKASHISIWVSFDAAPRVLEQVRECFKKFLNDRENFGLNI